ncbi:MAG: acylphosphatase [Desulfobacterales bacterium]
MKEKKVRTHVIVSGRVQGVWFRAETQKAAQAHGVTGWVRNRSDGTVEAVFEGEENKVVSMLEWCKTGSPLSDVQKTDVQWKDYKGEFSQFSIVR